LWAALTAHLEEQQSVRVSSANVGAAAEALVATRLLMMGYEVARPFSDNGIDFIVYRRNSSRRFVPVQVKSAASDRISFERKWFISDDLLVVFVWLSKERCFVFDGIADVERFLGPSANTPTWREQGVWAITSFGPAQRERIAPFDAAWHKLERRFTLLDDERALEIADGLAAPAS
jgi:hypothetical protein